MSRPRVLFLTPTMPWPEDSGGRLRTSQLLRRAGRDAELTLFSVETPGQSAQPPAHLESACREIRVFPRARPGLLARLALPQLERSFYSRALSDATQVALASRAFDVVHVDELSGARALGFSSQVPALIHHHKLDAHLHAKLSEHRRGVSDGEVAKVRALEKKVARAHSAHATCSEVEARLLRDRYGVRCAVIPNGVDADRFQPAEAPREAETLLFVGTLDYEPNIHGLEWFVAEVMPRLLRERPELRLQIAGSAPSDRALRLAGEGVEVLGPVSDPLPLLQRSSCSIAPLFIGGGTRIKILESLAACCPVVSTPVGAEGLELPPGALPMASTPEAFSAAILSQLAAPDAERSRSTSDYVRSSYSWDVSAAALLEAWESCAASTAS